MTEVDLNACVPSWQDLRMSVAAAQLLRSCRQEGSAGCNCHKGWIDEHHLFSYGAVMTDMLLMYGLRASGTTTLPSAC